MYYVGRNYRQKSPKLLLKDHPVCLRGPSLCSPREPPWTIWKSTGRRKKLDPTGSSIISKSTLSNVNPPLQFCSSCLAKPASYLPLGSTHLSKPVGPGQTKKIVNKLKRVNAVGLGSVNSLSRANQPKRYTGRLCGTQPRSRTQTFTKTITKTENNLPSITSISEVSRSYLVPPRNKMKAHAIADVSDALTSLSPPILDLLPVTVATTCTKAR